MTSPSRSRSVFTARKSGTKARILLTNYSQLEYLLLRDRDVDLFRGAPLRYLVLDEVHTYTGALGSEVACLIRRLRQAVCKSPSEVVCIGTSATVQDAPDSLPIWPVESNQDAAASGIAALTAISPRACLVCRPIRSPW